VHCTRAYVTMDVHIDGELAARSQWTKRWRGRYFALHDGTLTWWESEAAAHAPVGAGAGDGDDGGAWRPTGKAVGSVALHTGREGAGCRPRVVALDSVLHERLVSEVPALATPLQQAAAALAATATPLKAPGALDRKHAFLLAFDGSGGGGTAGMREPLVATPAMDTAAAPSGASAVPAPDAEALVWLVALSCVVEGVPLPDKWRAALAERYARRRVVHQRYRCPDLPRPSLAAPATTATLAHVDSGAGSTLSGRGGGRDSGRGSISGLSTISLDGPDAGLGAISDASRAGGFWTCDPDGAERVMMRARM